MKALLRCHPEPCKTQLQEATVILSHFGKLEFSSEIRLVF